MAAKPTPSLDGASCTLEADEYDGSHAAITKQNFEPDFGLKFLFRSSNSVSQKVEMLIIGKILILHAGFGAKETCQKSLFFFFFFNFRSPYIFVCDHLELVSASVHVRW